MKVILLKDVPKVGQIHEVKEVADGFALNSLIPRGLAIVATPEKLAAHKKKLEVQQKQAAETEKQMVAKLSVLCKESVRLHARLDQKGHLYKKIDARTLCDALAQKGVTCTERAFEKFTPIREAGEHRVVMTMFGKKWTVPLYVEGEK